MSRLRTVSLTYMRKLIGARIVQRIYPEATAEVRHLKDDRLSVERVVSRAIDDVLIGTGDERLLRLDIVGKHRISAYRCNGKNSSIAPALRCFCKTLAAIM